MKFARYLLLLSLIFSANPAFGHSTLLSSNPAASSTLLEIPDQVRLEFNEDLLLVGDLNPNKIEVFDNQGNLVSGEVSVEKQLAFASINSGTPPGDFTVKYRVTSSDGHPITGEFQFSVTTPEVISAPITQTPAEDGPNLLIRIIWGLLLVSGIGILFLLRRR